MARLDLKRGKAQYDRYEKTQLAGLYRTGNLAKAVAYAEAAYGDRKKDSVANFLGPRMSE